ncbi:MAG: hypothetical protein ACPHRO_11325, partial [Nannocystaceae bacterium]
IPAVRANTFQRLGPAASATVSMDVAVTHRVLPIAVDHVGNLTLAMADPTDDVAVRAVTAKWGGYVIRAAAPVKELDDALIARFGPLPMPSTKPDTVPMREEHQQRELDRPASSSIRGSRTQSRTLAAQWSPPLRKPQRAAIPLSHEAAEVCIAALKRAPDRDSLLAHILDFIGTGFAQTILFVHSHDELRGIDARGANIDREAVRQVRFDSTSPSLFRTAIDRMMPLFGPMPRVQDVDKAFSQALGGIHGNVLVLPIMVEHRVPLVCFAHGTKFSVRNDMLLSLSDTISEELLRLFQHSRA